MRYKLSYEPSPGRSARGEAVPGRRSQDGGRGLPAPRRRPGACAGMRAGRAMWRGPAPSTARRCPAAPRRGPGRLRGEDAVVRGGEPGEVGGAVGGGEGRRGWPGRRRRSAALGFSRGERERPRPAAVLGQPPPRLAGLCGRLWSPGLGLRLPLPSRGRGVPCGGRARRGAATLPPLSSLLPRRIRQRA